MGNKSSRQKSNNCCSQRNSFRKDSNKWKRLYYKENRNHTHWKKQYQKMRINYNSIKEQVLNSGNAKNKAKELFRQLESQYVDRLDYIETQENLINKQNTLINDKEDVIDDQKKEMQDTNDKISTHKRSLLYDQQDSQFYSNITAALKLFLLIIAIIVIILLAKQAN
jgi:hypothetical protein